MSLGKFTILATPIGNLSDFTYRGIEELENCDLILSEDTRETAKLLDRYNIKKPQIPYTDQKHDKLFPEILNKILHGEKICLVSDSGTPLISDPGFDLARNLIKNDIKVEIVPGPSAPIAALAVSGLPTDKFTFIGFLPKKSGEQINLLKKYLDLDTTLIFFESPLRLKETLNNLNSFIPDRFVCIIKDLTKTFEKINRGFIKDIYNLSEFDLKKGEFVVLIAKEGYFI